MLTIISFPLTAKDSLIAAHSALQTKPFALCCQERLPDSRYGSYTVPGSFSESLAQSFFETLFWFSPRHNAFVPATSLTRQGYYMYNASPDVLHTVNQAIAGEWAAQKKHALSILFNKSSPAQAPLCFDFLTKSLADGDGVQKLQRYHAGVIQCVAYGGIASSLYIFYADPIKAHTQKKSAELGLAFEELSSIQQLRPW